MCTSPLICSHFHIKHVQEIRFSYLRKKKKERKKFALGFLVHSKYFFFDETLSNVDYCNIPKFRILSMGLIVYIYLY